MSRIEKAIEKASQLRGKRLGTTPLVEIGPLKAVQAPVVPVKPTELLRPEDPRLVVNRNPCEEVTEEYRKLKSVVFELTRQGAFHNTLLVTSDLPGAGKTLTALNLALTMANEYDHTVLLVDADLRKPSVHERLGIQAEKGLLHCLTEGYPLEKALVRTGIGKLVVLPAGGTADDPAELLASNRMRDLIAELKARYPDRYVLFDTTPVLPFAEASVLGTMVDGILFVVRERQTRSDHLQEALAMLQGGNLLGVVYNDAAASQNMSHYRIQYGKQKTVMSDKCSDEL
jgi:exopolysaccharide/PEP-CTERM locus tyrosine autokinase